MTMAANQIRIKGKDWLSVVPSSEVVLSDTPFNIVVTAKNGHGDTDTAYTSCQILLSITDQDGAQLEYSVGGVDGVEEATMMSGVATYSNVLVVVGTATQIHIGAQTKFTTAAIKGSGFETHVYTPSGEQVSSAGTLTLVFTVSPTSTLRDTAFSMTVQAQDGAGNKIAGATDTITITMTSSDAADKFKSPTPDAVTYTASLTAGEWSTATEQITGGAGADDITITASATGYVSDSFDMDVTIVTSYSHVAHKSYSGSDTDQATGTDDSDGGTSARFVTSQNDAISNLDADTSLSSNSIIVARWQACDIYNYINIISDMDAGFIQFDAVDNTNASGARITLKPYSRQRNLTSGDSGTGSWYNWADAADDAGLTMKILLSESASFTTAGDLRATSSVHLSKTFTEIKAAQIAAGGGPKTAFAAAEPVDLTFDLDASVVTFLAGMTGTTVYAWVWITGTPVSYKDGYQNGTGTTTSSANGFFAAVDATNAALEILAHA